MLPNRLPHSKGDVKRSSEEKNMVTNSSELQGWRTKHIKMSNSGLRDCTQLESRVFLLLPRQKNIQHPLVASKRVSFSNQPHFHLHVTNVEKWLCITSHSSQPAITSTHSRAADPAQRLRSQSPQALLRLSVQGTKTCSR